MTVLEVVGAHRMTELGRAVGAACRAGDVIALVGDLGAGKTTFVQGLARGLGVPAEPPVVSPTFTIVNEHLGGRVPLSHVDLYRLEHARELEHVGLWDLYRGDHVVAVEWFDRFAEPRPRDFLAVRLVRDVSRPEVRTLTLEAHGAGGARLFAAARAWHEAAGDRDA